MLKKIKSLSAAVSVVVMTVPALVSAQFNTPTAGETGLPSGTISNILSNLMKWILGIVGILGVIGFAIAGILYLTAAGDDDRIKTAKKAMMYSIVGILVALMGLIIMQAIKGALGGQSNF
jgi:hypothetical protein